METIDRSASTSQHQEEFDTEDEILCSILSSLSLREAVRTSVVSPRWRHLWTDRTKLTFDDVNVFGIRTVPGRPLSVDLVHRFIRSVNSVLRPRRLQGPRVDELSIRYYLVGRDYSRYIDEWVGFAITSKTRSFDLHLLMHDPNQCRTLYVFPLEMLESPSFMERLSLTNCCLRRFDYNVHYVEQPCKLDGLSRLRGLTLSDVDVSDEVLNDILASCSSTLRELSLWDSLGIWGIWSKTPRRIEMNATNLLKLTLCNIDVNEEDFNLMLSNCSSTLKELCMLKVPRWESISIIHPLSQLRSLVIQDCPSLKKIEINAVNLLKLDYEGVAVDFRFTQTSQLNDAHIYFKTQGAMLNLDLCLAKLSSELPHLYFLNLKTCGLPKVANLPKGSSTFTFIYLTCLDWEWNDGFQMNPLHLATLLYATPFLEELNLSTKLIRVVDQPPKRPIKFREMLTEHPHPNLMIIKISGFYFDNWQIEIVAYLLNIANKLESMTIKKGGKSAWFSSKETHERGMEILSQEVPENVKLVIM